MIKFFIADNLSSDAKHQFTVKQALLHYQKLPYTVIIAPKESQKNITDLLEGLWPKRAILVTPKPTKGCLCVTDQLIGQNPAAELCIINTNSSLMIEQKNCKVLIEIIYENRDAGREKYKHHMQSGNKPDVEHIK